MVLLAQLFADFHGCPLILALTWSSTSSHVFFAFAQTSGLLCSDVQSLRRIPVVEEIYIKELKAHKPSPIWTAATELAAYDAAEPTTTDESAATSSAGELDRVLAFLTFLEAEVKPAEAHH
ncbi:hypothetical protein EDD15DRAFT_2374615 [Pisolithus albus]|nr:hypothetical protein EDD15DRAFT_2374615 [Pisolithus albus]